MHVQIFVLMTLRNSQANYEANSQIIGAYVIIK